jgi:hypothetical protein
LHSLHDRKVSPSSLGVYGEGICLLIPPTDLHRHFQSPAELPFCVPSSLKFSWKQDYMLIALSCDSAYYQLSASLADLPTKDIPTTFNAQFRMCAALSLLRHPIAARNVASASSSRFTYFRTLHGTISRMKQANLKATFHSPATTVPLRTTATRSMLPICLQTAFAVRLHHTSSVGTGVHQNEFSVLRLEPVAVSIQRPDASSYLRSPPGG